ncbi:MAG: helicase C-terminal domain-containing protein, partial [Nanoarchaeota archaeon]|nr:helicase C-terminal domain-containing protein [Nanoarchaeota archaeon]
LKKGFSKKGDAHITLSYRCLDPSMILKPISEEARIICMSGTLMPTQMYKDLFGFEAETKEYNDPFPKQNRLNIIVPKTTTKFTQRDPEMWQKIAVVTSKMINAIPGNSAVFFPSYYILERVNDYLRTLCEKTTFIEHPNMSKEERDMLLEKYKTYKDQGAVLLGCSSGSFGEGIDLPGDYLKAVVIVGLPLSKPDLETKQLIDYYDQRFGKGWDYGYIYPALLKVIQNAGRCIRSEKDKGIRIFLDERYQWQNYYRCFPKDWQIKTTRTPMSMIEEFFKK